MKMKLNKRVLAAILNIISSVLVILGVLLIMFGKGTDETLASSSYAVFKYFTVDSNILAAIFCAYTAAVQLKKDSTEKDFKRAYYLKHLGTVGVALTFMTVVVFLAPRIENGWVKMLASGNLFLHLIVPLLCIFSFVSLEKSPLLNRNSALFGLIPMGIYGIFYTVNALTHIENNAVSLKYDWYGFIQGGVNFVFVAVPVMFAGTYLIGYLLWKSNKISS